MRVSWLACLRGFSTTLAVSERVCDLLSAELTRIVVLTRRAAATAELVSSIRACVPGHFGLKRMSEKMNESRQKIHAVAELQYYSLRRDLRDKSVLSSFGSLPPVTTFSAFNDAKGYAGKTVSPQWVGAVLKAHDYQFGPIMDRAIFSGSGEILQADASYNVSTSYLSLDVC